MVPTEPTYLIIRSTNHGGHSRNASIWPADSAFSSVGPLSCMPSHLTTTRSPASPFSSSPQSSSCYSYVLSFFVTHQLTNFTHIPPTSLAPHNVYMSSVHMQSPAQDAGRWSFIYPAFLPTSSSSAGIL